MSSSDLQLSGELITPGIRVLTLPMFSLQPSRIITTCEDGTSVALTRYYATAKKTPAQATARSKKVQEDTEPSPPPYKPSSHSKTVITPSSDSVEVPSPKKSAKKSSVAATTKIESPATSAAKSRLSKPAITPDQSTFTTTSTKKKLQSSSKTIEETNLPKKREATAKKSASSLTKPALRRSASSPTLESSTKEKKVSAKKTSTIKQTNLKEEIEVESTPRVRNRPKRSVSAIETPSTEKSKNNTPKPSSRGKATAVKKETTAKSSTLTRSTAATASSSDSLPSSTVKRGRAKSMPLPLETETPAKRGRKSAINDSVVVELPKVVKTPLKSKTVRAAKKDVSMDGDTKKSHKEVKTMPIVNVGATPELPGPDEEFVITPQLVKMISEDIAREEWAVKNTLRLLLEGNTVPFITRYRKEMIGEMDETHVRSVHKTALQYTALQERKVTVLETMRTKHADKLSPELEREILSTMSMRHLEDLYAPYKPKKNSLADVAISRGLLPAAESLLTRLYSDHEFMALLVPLVDASRDLNSIGGVLQGIQHIWAEKASDSVHVRHAVRPIYAEFGSLATSELISPSRISNSEISAKGSSAQREDSRQKDVPARKRADTYTFYFNFNKPLNALKSHNVMAINRGEREKFLKVKFFVPEPEVLSSMAQAFIKDFPTLDKFQPLILSEFTTMGESSSSSSPVVDSSSLSSHSPALQTDIIAKTLDNAVGSQKKPNSTNFDENGSEVEPIAPSSNSSPTSTPEDSDESIGPSSLSMDSKMLVAGEYSSHCTLLRDSILDGFKRLLHPSLVKEARNTVTEAAESDSIATFGNNLRSLLLKPPVSGHVILSLDPGFTHGCKTCIIDENGKVLYTRVIFPFVDPSRIIEKLREFDQMVRKFHVTLVAIGNGTAHKQAMDFIKLYKKQANEDLLWCIVDESGASVYSVSPEAQAEFPGLDPAGRGAASIARRTLDPMAEIVKIPTQSIGVGSYQHDVNQKELERSLSSVVEDCVNYVGVNVNTASQSLLRRVSGLSGAQAQSIVKYRDTNGGFMARTQLLDVKGIGPRTYTQCAGFLRIPDSAEPLDNTNIHPESYPKATALLKSLKFTTKDIIDPKKKVKLHEALNHIDMRKAADELGLGVPTLSDIINDLLKPGRDPRATAHIIQLDNQISSFEELKVGQTLVGRVVNVTGFGAFVDVGIEHKGLMLPKDLIDPVTNLRVPSFTLAISPGYVGNFEVLGVDIPRKRFTMRLFLTDTQKLM